MLDAISIGDMTQDVFLWVSEAEVNCDIDKTNCKLSINYAEKSKVDRLERALGGNACNNAVSLARLGKKAAYFGICGTDDASQVAVSEIKNEGVDISLTQMVDGKRINYATVIIFKGERTELVYHDQHEYIMPLDLPAANYLYISSVGQDYKNFYPQVINYLDRTKANLVFNPSSHELRQPIATYEPLLRASFILVANKEEVEKILGFPKGTQDIKMLLTGWRKFGNKYAVLTDGTNGSYCFDGNKYYSLGLFEPFQQKMIQQTGAGDAFAGGFMAAVMNGLSTPDAMRWGTINAGSVVTKVGAQAGLLRSEEMLKLISDNPSFQPREI